MKVFHTRQHFFTAHFGAASAGTRFGKCRRITAKTPYLAPCFQLATMPALPWPITIGAGLRQIEIERACGICSRSCFPLKQDAIRRP
jgi:hypothetical protein